MINVCFKQLDNHANRHRSTITTYTEALKDLVRGFRTISVVANVRKRLVSGREEVSALSSLVFPSLCPSAVTIRRLSKSSSVYSRRWDPPEFSQLDLFSLVI